MSSKTNKTLHYLRKFCADRVTFDFYRQDSDVMRLRRLEAAIVTLLGVVTLGLVRIASRDDFWETPWQKWMVAGLFLYILFLGWDLARVHRAVDLFIQNGIQSVDELIGKLSGDEDHSDRG